MTVIGQEPEAAPAVAPVPEAPTFANTTELRLALVCYGGVSLAIYMHGVTKEIQKLVAASKAYEKNQDRCPFDEQDTEWAYWHAIKRREEDEGVRTRVVVDVIAGTSAGGINGIILAKALAHDLPQDSLRDVWLDRGDIKKLLGRPFVPTMPLKVATWLAGGFFKRRLDPPLDGNRMFCWIHDALKEMDAEGKGETLMPDQHPLELYVTLTDFSGYYRGVPMDDPANVKDRRHRHVLVFSYGDGTDQLHKGWNPALAFAARATSCFPGAFPPISLANIDLNEPGWEGLEQFKADCWSIYELSEENLADRYFVDGGVLDNFPFRHAIDAVRQRPASLEVDRKLIYIEPHPAPRKKPPDGTAPSLRSTVTGGLSALPRHEPILDDLLALRAFNERVDRAADVIRAASDRIFELAPPAADAAEYEARSGDVIEKAKEGVGYATYTELKLHSVVDSFADLATAVCDYPPDSNHAFLVHDVLVEWARTRELLKPAVEPSPKQIEFLKVFDLLYAERRLRFVIRRLNSVFDREPALRRSVNEAKEALYGEIATLRGAAAEAGAGKRGDAVRAVFERDALRELIEGDEAPADVSKAFVEEHGERIDGLRRGLETFLNDTLGDFGKDGYQALLDATDGWDRGVRDDLLARYVGYPLWDVLIFPIMAVSDLGELNRVEVVRFSPEDVSLLKAPGQKGERPTTEDKLEGVKLGHFGAFFSREGRENDYLWGRLDSAERLMGLLLGKPPEDLCNAAFRGVLDQEQAELTKVPNLVRHLREDLATGPSPSS